MSNVNLITAGALRQYLSNTGEGPYISAYDKEITDLVTAQDALDAARYRWLRSPTNTEGASYVAVYGDESLDRVVDSAIAADKAAS